MALDSLNFSIKDFRGETRICDLTWDWGGAESVNAFWKPGRTADFRDFSGELGTLGARGVDCQRWSCVMAMRLIEGEAFHPPNEGSFPNLEGRVDIGGFRTEVPDSCC
jgi:hypothetical protein